MATTAETLQSLLEGETANTGAINALTKQMAGTTASGLKTKIETLDGQVVKTTGNQSVNGVKTFNNRVVAHGGVITDTGYFACRNSSDGAVVISGGTMKEDGSGAFDNNGARITLYGGNHSAKNGDVDISVVDANGNYKVLVLKPDGTFAWDGKIIINNTDTQSINGLKTFLNLITANKGIVSNTGYFACRNTSDGAIILTGGTKKEDGSFNSDGAKITLFGSSHATEAGKCAVSCYALDGSFKTLTLNPNGTLTWGGADVNGEGFGKASMPDYNNSKTCICPDSGGKYTAPCNGYFRLKVKSKSPLASNEEGYCSLWLGAASSSRTGLAGAEIVVSIPAKKGDEVTVNYNNVDTKELKFYACCAETVTL